MTRFLPASPMLVACTRNCTCLVPQCWFAATLFLFADQALREGRLSRADLGWCHPYQPSLSASWLFQRSMSVAPGQLQQPPCSSGEHDSDKPGGVCSSGGSARFPSWAQLPAGHVNAVLACNFSVMKVGMCLHAHRPAAAATAVAFRAAQAL